MEKVIATLEEQVTVLRKRNAELERGLEAVRKENAELNEELDAMVAEPQWFSHRGDWCVVLFITLTLVSAVYMVGNVQGWWS